MDPTQATPPPHSDAFVAMLFAVCMGLIEVVKKLVPWFLRRRNGGGSGHSEIVARFDPEIQQAIRDTNERTQKMYEIMDRRDAYGANLVYFPRSFQDKVEDDLSDIKHELRRSGKS
jgi:hypothetical protein